MQAIDKILLNEAIQIASLLKTTRHRLVFAESCTGGMLAACLTGVAGISENFCGSAVVYRNDTKIQWLGINKDVLDSKGAVSAEVAAAMALNVLNRTPEATIAAAITGHLGPNAPRKLDGVAYIAIAEKCKKPRLIIKRIKLPHRTKDLRRTRQKAASHAVMFMVRSLLTRGKPKGEK